jgi:hypothetical protein
MADDANPEILELGILPYNTVIREKQVQWADGKNAKNGASVCPHVIQPGRE